MKKIFLVLIFCAAQLCAMDPAQAPFRYFIQHNIALRELCAYDITDQARPYNIGHVRYHYMSGTKVYIDFLSVLPDYRERGIGRQLLTEALNSLKACGVTCFELEAIAEGHYLPEIEANQERLIRFYKSFGFECCDDEGIMRLHV